MMIEADNADANFGVDPECADSGQRDDEWPWTAEDGD